MTNMNEAIESIKQSIDQMIETTKSLSEETIRWNPSEEEWSIMQILCHVEEAIPYWLNEIERLLESPGAEWGRGLTDENRLAAVANTEKREVSEVLNKLENVKDQVEKVLSKLSEEDLKSEAPSRNPRFGTKPMSFIVDHLLVEHASKHYSQIQRNLSKL